MHLIKRRNKILRGGWLPLVRAFFSMEMRPKTRARDLKDAKHFHIHLEGPKILIQCRYGPVKKLDLFI